jgi:hypothetical protein
MQAMRVTFAWGGVKPTAKKRCAATRRFLKNVKAALKMGEM